MKRHLTAPLLFSPWAHRLGSHAQTFSAQERLVGGCLAGLIIGVISAMVFMLTSLLFSARLALLVALMSALVIDLMAAQSRRLLPLHEPAVTPLSALALGIMLMTKVELLSDIDPEWMGVILICSAGWARSATLTARAEPLLDCRAAPPMARAFGLWIGAAPLLLFALWPEPVWGLWVAAAVGLWCARLLAPRTWAAPITVRWMASELVYCLCVLALMSAAAVAEISIEETPAS